MYKKLMYNLIDIRPDECEEDLVIFYTPGEGVLSEVDPIDRGEYNNFIYKLYIGSTYVVGPHRAINTLGNNVYVDSTYNIYRVLRLIPTTPYITYMGTKPQVAELVEVEVKFSSNRLTYYNFLYGD